MSSHNLLDLSFEYEFDPNEIESVQLAQTTSLYDLVGCRHGTSRSTFVCNDVCEKLTSCSAITPVRIEGNLQPWSTELVILKSHSFDVTTGVANRISFNIELVTEALSSTIMAWCVVLQSLLEERSKTALLHCFVIFSSALI